MRLNVTALMYHDVTETAADFASSGFVSPDADMYKLVTRDFETHLQLIGARLKSQSRQVQTVAAQTVAVQTVLSRSGATSSDNQKDNFQQKDVLQSDDEQNEAHSLMLTFDDGGASAFNVIAPMLEANGWQGHFFVSTAYIDTPTFLSRAQIRDLHRRGHIIGSHSHTHPLRMAQLSRTELLNEWQTSTRILADILEVKTTVASIPGGQYSRAVAETAAANGIKHLFTSEPVTRTNRVDGCTLYGRYAMQRWTTAATAADIATGRRLPRLRQYALWNAKKIVKRVGGEAYLKTRAMLAKHSN